MDNKEVKEKGIIIGILFIFLYACTAFILAELNPFQWSMLWRGIFVGCCFIGLSIMFGSEGEHDSDNY